MGESLKSLKKFCHNHVLKIHLQRFEREGEKGQKKEKIMRAAFLAILAIFVFVAGTSGDKSTCQSLTNWTQCRTHFPACAYCSNKPENPAYPGTCYSPTKESCCGLRKVNCWPQVCAEGESCCLAPDGCIYEVQPLCCGKNESCCSGSTGTQCCTNDQKCCGSGGNNALCCPKDAVCCLLEWTEMPLCCAKGQKCDSKNKRCV